MNFDVDDILALLVLGQGEGNGDVGEILGELACSAHLSQPIIFLPRCPSQSIFLTVVVAVPRGPSTVTILERMWILTPSGTTSCSCEKMYFILSSGLAN